MNDFSKAWTLSRSRFLETISDLNFAQLNWRVHPKALTIAEMAVHVAGVEVSFAAQLTDRVLDEVEAKLKAAAVDGVVNFDPFPYDPRDLTPAFVADSLEISRRIVAPIISVPTPAILEKEIVSVLGPRITGEGALTRLAFHAAYHQGQAHLIRTAPGFP